MFELAILLTQTVAVAALTLWMFTGLRDNILYPSQNEAFTAEVLEMRRLKDGFPDAHAPVAHRAVTDRTRQLRLFRIVVLAEALAFVLLAAGTVSLALAMLGAAEPDTARAVALIGTAAFSSVWAGMLIVGNHFCFRFGHEGAQLTHFHMCLWGLLTALLLVAA